MKLARLGLEDGPRYAILDDEAREFVLLSDDPMFGRGEPTSQRIPVENARIISPMIPRSKVIGFGGSMTGGKAESTSDLMVFVKPNTSVIGPNEPIIIPKGYEISHECEIAVVIGGVAKDLTPEKAEQAIFGYTVANDVTSTHPCQAAAKGADTFCPVGPYIETELDPAKLALTSRVNGQQVIDSSTAHLPFSVAELVAYASQLFTLLPGDIILTGSPGGSGPVKDRDIVEVSVEGIGVLRNTVVAR